jgi:hypothetical protein
MALYMHLGPFSKNVIGSLIAALPNSTKQIAGLLRRSFMAGFYVSTA